MVYDPMPQVHPVQPAFNKSIKVFFQIRFEHGQVVAWDIRVKGFGCFDAFEIESNKTDPGGWVHI